MRMLVELLPPAAASLDEELLDDCGELLDDDDGELLDDDDDELLYDDSELLGDDEEPNDEDPPPPAAPPPPLGWRKPAAASSLERYAKDFTRTKSHFSSLLASASFGTATRSILVHENRTFQWRSSDDLDGCLAPLRFNAARRE
jgi:hypothetical protein